MDFKRVIIVLVSGLIALGCTCSRERYVIPKTPGSTPIRGIDISHHNIINDWSDVAEDGVSFVFAKATEGATYQDNKFTGSIRGARAAGLKVGAYHFLTTSSSATAQFDNFKSVVKKSDIDLCPVLDAEIMTKGHAMTDKEYVKHVRTWVDLCKAHYGKAPILYCSIEHYRKYFKGHFKDCKFWCGDVDAKKSYADLVHWVMWQYTIGPVKGSAGYLDLNMLGPGVKLTDLYLK